MSHTTIARVLLTFGSLGLELTHATPGVGYVPWVQQGRAYAVIDSDAAINNVTTDSDSNRIVEVGHNHQIGAIVVPVNGAIIVPELGLTWTTSQLDFDASGTLDGDDAAMWMALYEQQSPLCDFDADGQTNADDRTLWSIAVEAARPEYTVACDANADGWNSADDFDLWVGWFIDGDVRADFISDGFISGEDYDAFVLEFEKGGDAH